MDDIFFIYEFFPDEDSNEEPLKKNALLNLALINKVHMNAQNSLMKGDLKSFSREIRAIEKFNPNSDISPMLKLLADMCVDEARNGYLMYPKVFLDYMGRRRTYGPVTVLPTAVFFYGMDIAEEISVDIGDGKTLEIRLLAVGESNEEGDVKVFFELNGQPRTIRVPDRSV